MDAERWQRLRAVFERAVRLDGAARRRHLEQVAADDPVLAREVESLLGRAEAVDARLEPGPGAAIGTRLNDRYELTRILGRGGMAAVYEATDHRLDRTVVVKLLAAHPLAGEMAERFRREARLTARLDHPAIVPVFDHGVDAGRLFLVMPKVSGHTLRARVAEGCLDPSELMAILGPIADALAHSHRLGVVHRDVKPENIMISDTDDGPAARLMDFGLARALDDPRLTDSGTLVGTPAYMSPEQVAGRPVDGRCDVYALGAVLYECLVGEPPFTGATHAVLHAVVADDAVPPRRRGVDVSPELERLVLACLAKDPAQRPADGRALHRALRAGGLAAPFARVQRAVAVVLLGASGWWGWSAVDRALDSGWPAGAAARAHAPVEQARAAPLTTRRVRHSATLLHDGRVLVASGTTWEPFLSVRLREAEVYFPSFDTWRAVADLDEARDLHVAVLLRDGRPVAIGGEETGGRLCGVETLDPLGRRWTPLADLLVRRHSFTATVLDDGRILVAGGPTLSTELYDPVADAWRSAGELSVERRNRTATRLADGRVLMVGGRVEARRLASAEVYDPSRDRWSPAASLAQGRWLHSATLLPDGRVLVAGGEGEEARSSLGSTEILDPRGPPSLGSAASAGPLIGRPRAVLLPDDRVLVVGVLTPWVYEPSADRWRLATSPPAPRAGGDAVWLADGRLLWVGGRDADGRPTAEAAVFDPDANRWSAIASLATARAGHTVTRLVDGRVAVIGGVDEAGAALASVEVYDPPADRWTAATLSEARTDHGAIALPDGGVWVVGGLGAAAEPLDSFEVLDRDHEPVEAAGRLLDARAHHAVLPWIEPDLGLVRLLVIGGHGDDSPLTSVEVCHLGACVRFGRLEVARSRPSATRLADGRVLVVGGEGVDGPVGVTEIIQAGRAPWRRGPTLAEPRIEPAAVLLADGTLLVVGGLTASGPTSTVERFDPRPDLASVDRPSITRWSRTLRPGEPLDLVGVGFRTISTGSGGLGGQASPSDHPLVHLRSQVDGRQAFLPVDPTVGWSATTFQALPVDGLPPGPARVSVVTQAAWSTSRLVLIEPAREKSRRD